MNVGPKPTTYSVSASPAFSGRVLKTIHRADQIVAPLAVPSDSIGRCDFRRECLPVAEHSERRRLRGNCDILKYPLPMR